MKFLSKIFDKYSVLIFLIISIVLIFWPVFVKGEIPFPGDILLGNYHPWKDVIWSNRVTGYIVKNAELSDVLTQYYPFKLETVEQLKLGKIPWNNPYIFSGAPLLADGHSGVLYPLNFIFWLSNNFNFCWSIFIVIQPFLAGLFFYVFLRSVDFNKISSVFGSLIFALNSYFINQVEFGTVMHTLLWIPLSLWSLNKIAKNQKKMWLVLSFSLAMSFLAGFIQFFIYHCLLLVGYYFLVIKDRLKILPYLLLSVFLFLIISSPELVPWLKLLPQTARWQGIGLDESMSEYLIKPKMLLTTIAPDFFGSPVKMNWFGSNHHYYEFIFYGGCFSIISLFFCSFKQKINRYFGLVLLLSLVLCLDSPLTRFLYWLKIPVFSSLNPARLLSLVVISIAFLATVGFSNLAKAKFSVKKLFIVGGFIVLSFLTYWLFFIKDPVQKTISLRNCLIPFCLTGVSVLVLIIYLKYKKNFLLWILVGLNTFSLIYQGNKFNSFIPADLIFPQTKTTEFLQQNVLFGEKILVIHPEVLPVNVNMVYKLATPNGYHPVQLAEYNRQMSWLQVPDKPNYSFGRTIFLTRITEDNLKETKVRYVLTLDDIKYPFLKNVFTEGKTKVYEYGDE